MSPAPFASLNGRIIPWEQATMHVFSTAAKYGQGLFEGVRAYWNAEQSRLVLFRIDDHLRRLMYGHRAIRFDQVFTIDELKAQTIALLQACNYRESVAIRIMSFLDGQGDMTVTGPIGTAITALAKPMTKAVENGISVQVSSWARIPDQAMPARVKVNANYHNSRLAHMQAITDGYDNALLLNTRGHVSEAPTAALFMVRDGILSTPARSEDILESITRDTVLRLAQKIGLETEERVIARSELYAADELFICGSGAEITPIKSVDRIAVGAGVPGTVTRSIQKAYFDLVFGRSDLWPEWLYDVPLTRS